MRGLNWRYLRGDVTANRGVTVTLAILLMLCAALMGIGAGTVERLAAGVNSLHSATLPPHFLQMHYGDYDEDAIADFADHHAAVDSWLIEEMVGVDAALISWDEGDLSASVIDNLFVAQNENFDFLVDADTGLAPHAQRGEVFVPLQYRDQFNLDTGTTLNVAGIPYVIRGFVRDGQMVSSLAGSTRFLVHPAELDALATAGGEPEIIVEFRVHDPAQDVATLQADYQSNPALPRNGQTITDTLLKLVAMLSSGVVALALVGASLTLILIALVAVNFVTRGSLEDQIRQIGVLKAIGVSERDIAFLFLLRYLALTAVGCVLGYLVALTALGPLTTTYAAAFGNAPTSAWTFLIPAIAVLLVGIIVIGLCALMLRRLRRVNVITALVHGQATMAPARKPLRLGRPRNVNLQLASIDLRSDARHWILLPIVFFLATMLVMLPANLASTFTDPRIAPYLGIEQVPVWVSGEGASLSTLRPSLNDPRIERATAVATVLARTPGEKGLDTIPVEVGDHSASTLAFSAGRAPGPGEAAVSVLTAQKYGLEVGDGLPLFIDARDSTFPITGIYPDITGGGYTTLLSAEIPEAPERWTVYIHTEAPDEIAQELSDQFPDAEVGLLDEYATAVLDTPATAFSWATGLAWFAAAATMMLMTTLFLSMRLRTERRRMGLLNVLGFSPGEIRGQVLVKTLVSALLGAAAAVAVLAIGGSALVSGVLQMAASGLMSLQLYPVGWLSYVLIPGSLVLVAVLAVGVATWPLRRINPSVWLRG